MRNREFWVIAILYLGVMFTLTSCEQTTNTELEESFRDVKQVTPITGAQNTTMDLKRGGGEMDSFFSVTLDNGKTLEGWCLEWSEPASFGLNEGTRLYSTKRQEAWKELNYFMSIKDNLRANDPSLTYREIQVVIWSLIDNPKFDVDNIGEYENISERIYKDGEPLFDVQKVKNIVNNVKSYFSSSKNKSETIHYYVTLVENNGQTVMTGSETAYAYGGELATCFDEEILETVSFPNWGWTNGPISDPSGELTWDMYAGAADCDLSKGTKVGELIVEYKDGTLNATFKMTETSSFTGKLFNMGYTQLYVGNDPYPTNNSKYTVAPGQYGNVTKHDPMVTEFSYTINDLSGDIYIIGHADVFGFDPDA